MLECEYDFQNYAMYVCLKSGLLDPKIEKSPTFCDFENFDPKCNTFFTLGLLIIDIVILNVFFKGVSSADARQGRPKSS